ncbi:MAG: hypothetical protein JW768_01340 [Chitinispirillaceae bacterium]|nr:hypothetical protein [Chitinispirillaceae bacterium]
MKSRLFEHIAGMIVVTIVLLLALGLADSLARASQAKQKAEMGRFGDLSFIDFNSAFERALLKDAINIFYPGKYDRNDSLFNAIVGHKQREFSSRLLNTKVSEKLTLTRLMEVMGMYAKFLLIYLLVMVLTYYGVQTLGVFRFVYKKRLSQFPAPHPGSAMLRALAAFFMGLCTMLLFCPAYVIAYSIRTEFNTDTAIFMVLLGVVSNGVLITYANKFYAFLVAESRKGYVETAVVKNLHASYRFHAKDGISFSSILSPVKKFKGHVLDHIFRNARFQYLSTIKEQASFLITGLIIIEMALNIHGHLNYEMLRQLLYKNYSIVIVIILFIFYTVKMTELFADVLAHREAMKYENKA